LEDREEVPGHMLGYGEDAAVAYRGVGADEHLNENPC
jgi:hypothetical protein